MTPTTTPLPARFPSVGRGVSSGPEAGGVAGVELTVKAHDTRGEDAPDPARAAAAARKMVNDYRTIAVVGPFTSPEAAETIPITNRR